MLTMAQRLRANSILAALFIAYLSIAAALATPYALQHGPTPQTNNSPPSSNLEGSNAISAAISSIQTGHGPKSLGQVSCSKQGSESASCNSNQGASASPTPTTSSTGSWSEIPRPGISARSSYSLAYDAVDSYVVLFGGITSIGAVQGGLGDTWKFIGGSWTNITTSNGPPARFGSSMAYDSVDGYAILFGGFYTTSATASCPTGGDYLRDTWKFVGGVWTNITTNQGPSPRAFSSITYDVPDASVVLFGGGTGSFYCFPTMSLGDTWKFSGGSWTNITTTGGPSARFAGSLAYDSIDGYGVLFGGQTNDGVMRDTWKFSGGSWTNITATLHPPARSLASMDYDAMDHYVVLFGGLSLSASTSLLGDTWKFSGGSWTNITGSVGPSVRFAASIAYDAAAGYAILFGGGINVFLRDTWKFVSGSWTDITPISGPSPRFGASMAYDASDGYVILFSGVSGFPSTSTSFSDTWKFSAGVWTNITTSPEPSARAQASMAYDPGDGYVVLFGGQNTTTGYTLGDTWKFQGGHWTNITPVTGYYPRAAASMAYDLADNYLVMFGGCCNQSGQGLGDTWKYQGGTWTNITTTPGPPPRFSPALAADIADGYVVLFGGVSTVTASGFTGFLHDTWKFSGGFWTNITSSSGPSSRVAGSLAYDDSDGFVVLFGGFVSSPNPSVLGDTWSFLAGSWTNITNTPGPLARFESVMTYDAADKYLLLFGGATNFVASADSWKFSAPSGAPPFDFSLAGPGSVTLAQGSTSPAFSLVATLAAGSTNPLSFSVVSSLPSGVTATFGNNLCSPTCTATISFMASMTATLGPSTVVVQATGGGVTKTINISLTVIVPFDFSLSTPTPPSLTVTQGSTSATSSITATLVSGSPSPVGFLVTSSSLPAGITPNFTNDPCTPTCEVTVSFTASNSAQPATYTLTILASGSSPPHTVQISLTVQAPAPPFDYSLSVTPNSKSIAAGSSTQAMVTATLKGGTPETVLLAVSISPNPSVCQSSYGYSSPCGTTTFAPTTVIPSSVGATSTLTITLTTIAPPGTYTLTITGTPAGASSSSATFTLTITAEASTLTASASANPTNGAAPLTVAFTGAAYGGTSPYTYSWNFGDGSYTSTQQDPTNQYLHAGIYTAVLTVTDSASQQATSQVIITVATTTPVECGHDLSCSVQSDSTLSNIRFAGNTIHIEADGHTGSVGYANVTVPKSAIPHIETLEVLLDNSKLESSRVTITSDSTNYYIYFTFTFHSPVLIDIHLLAPENAATNNILGLDPTIFYAVAGVLAAIVVVVAGFAYRARLKSKPIVR